MERFILDSNCFIEPHRKYYPSDIAPSFWRQMEGALLSTDVILLNVVKNELTKFEDDLSAWLNSIPGLHVESVEQDDVIASYRQVIQYVEGCGLYKKEAFDKWAQADCADPWIIACAASFKATVITLEVPGNPSPGQRSSKAKIPDVAAHFGVAWADLFSFMRKKGFRL